MSGRWLSDEEVEAGLIEFRLHHLDWHREDAPERFTGCLASEEFGMYLQAKGGEAYLRKLAEHLEECAECDDLMNELQEEADGGE